jgi:hypothetical protein
LNWEQAARKKLIEAIIGSSIAEMYADCMHEIDYIAKKSS